MAAASLYTIKDAEEGDLPELLRITGIALDESDISNRIIFSHGPRAKHLETAMVGPYKGLFAKKTSWFSKAVDANDKIVGFMIWYTNGGDQEPATAAPSGDSTAANSAAFAAAMASMPINMAFTKEMMMGPEMLKAKNIGKERHAYVFMIDVLPEYQGQGIGTMLSKAGFERSDKEGLNTWLMAAPTARKMYHKLGYEDIDFMEVDLAKWAPAEFSGWGLHRRYLMRRKPGASK